MTTDPVVERERAAPLGALHAVGRVRAIAIAGSAGVVVTLQLGALGHGPTEPGTDLSARLTELSLLLHGESPYPQYPYPPLTAFVFAGIAELPWTAVLWTALLLAAVPLSLWLLGVRDWRCFAVACLWPPVFQGVSSGNVTLVLLLGASAAWHGRTSAARTGIASALAIAVKPVAWPLAVWLAATGRRVAAIVAVAGAAALSLLLWAPLRFDGLGGYPAAMRELRAEYAADGYSLEAVLRDLGSSQRFASLAGTALTLLVLAAVAAAGRRGDDRRAFALACVAIAICSPIVWLHSFSLLLGAVAVLRPRLCVAWLVPLLMWLSVETGNGHGDRQQLYATVLIAVGTVVLAVLPPGSIQRAARRSETPPSSRIGASGVGAVAADGGYRAYGWARTNAHTTDPPRVSVDSPGCPSSPCRCPRQPAEHSASP